MADLAASFKDARDAWKPGASNPQPTGGPHKDVQKVSEQYKWESNHTPPKDAYKDTPYEWVNEFDMPAVSMHFYNHRNARGRLGGASSTGGSGVQKDWAETLRGYMKNKEFYKAMALDAIDILNTTHPNREYYQAALVKAADYARDAGLIDQDGHLIVIGVIMGQLTINFD